MDGVGVVNKVLPFKSMNKHLIASEKNQYVKIFTEQIQIFVPKKM